MSMGGARALHDMVFAHGCRTAAQAAERLGRALDADNLAQFLDEPGGLRYRTAIDFDAAPLEPHQFAEPVFGGPPEARTCRLCVHPRYRGRPESLPLFVAYMAAAINYGPAATPELCEATAAILLRVPPAAVRAALDAATR